MTNTLKWKRPSAIARTLAVNEVLDRVLDLYPSFAAWTKGATARDAAGRPVTPSDPSAVAWSLDGAIERVIGDYEDPSITKREATRRHKLELRVFAQLGIDPAQFNDITSFENVRAFVAAKALWCAPYAPQR
ncbi:hypothetical protein FPV16_06955 [Methylobacterium sp. W2]|uniref:hypothetical protein n=1 Tax=Methylobacterium sp. W2 TaxID=2598107 RepID=UPI001D0C8267|nr:hypothetical protein [Methylobacterium sp. W2]MCC0805964.1 hypothetical protein [Methylobacterium sp. W2]